MAAAIINLIFLVPFFKSLVPARPPPVSTTIRIGCGSGNFTSQNYGGNVPSVALWTDQLVRVGKPVTGKGNIPQGSFHDIKLDHYSNMGNTESQYIAVSAGGNNAICINYIAITWPDGDSAFISGDTGRACNRDWYYSRAVVGDQDNNYIPSCMWIDGDHSGGLHYQGFSFHIPDFPQNKARSQEYQQRPDLMCGATPSNARFGSWATLGVNDWPPMFSPELPAISGDSVDPESIYTQILGNGTQVGPGPYGIGNGESFRRKDRKHRRDGEALGAVNNDTRASDFIATLVSSDHVAHSAYDLCGSASSVGPDFVSVAEQMFCDMAAKEVWPVCSSEIPHGCFDLDSQIMVAPRNSRRDSSTGRTIPFKSYEQHHHWGTLG